jgi:hypothetical protein
MTVLFRHCTRWIAPVLLALGLTLSPAITPMARAQAPEEAAPADGESKGRPLDGYLGTVVLVMLALFIVGKSARR